MDSTDFRAAIAKARGRFVVLLQSQTVVGPGWLEGMISTLLADWPCVGVVGPVSNGALASQLVPPEYQDLQGLTKFVVQRRRQFQGRSLAVDRLSGFCLMVRRDAWNRLAAIDDTDGQPLLENLLCERARQAGLQLRVALNVYVHRFDGPLLSKDADPAEDVSNDSRTGQTRQTAQQASDEAPKNAALRETPPFRISLSMIVKNEERNLPACLESMADLVDELVIVDTGSRDATREIARRFGARVPEFPRVDSFAAARNESIRHCTGDWIFWMDADDRLDAANRERLRIILDRLRKGLPGTDAMCPESMSPFDAYVMTCQCVGSAGESTATEVHHVRLFRNHEKLRWQHRIHEQILPAVRRAGGVPHFCDVVIQHVGYSDKPLRLRKRDRDLRLLHLELAELPNHPFTLFNLGMTYLDMKQPGEALPLLERSLAGSAPADSIVRKLYYLIVQCHRQMNQPDVALEACRRGRTAFPQDAELLGQEASLLVERDDLDGARARYEQLLTSQEPAHFASVPIGLHGYLTRHNLAIVSMRQNRPAESEALWRAAVTEKPEFEAAWVGLEDLFVREKRWADLEWLANQLATQTRLKHA